MGTESNLAIRSYLNEKKVPQLFVESSSAAFDDPSHFPWTHGFLCDLSHGGIGIREIHFAKQTRREDRGAVTRMTTLEKSIWRACTTALATKSPPMIVKELSYPASDATLESQVMALKNSGVDVFLNLSVGAYADEGDSQRPRDINWHPLQFIPNASLSVAAFLDPAGLEKATGIIANARSKGWLEPQMRNDPAVREFLEWMAKYNPQASLRDQNNVAGYERAQALVEVLGEMRG